MTNRTGLDEIRNIRRFASDEYLVVKHHELDRITSIIGSSNRLEGAIFIADQTFLQDEKDYNDCGELEGEGIGYSYIVFNRAGKILYKAHKIYFN